MNYFSDIIKELRKKNLIAYGLTDYLTLIQDEKVTKKTLIQIIKTGFSILNLLVIPLVNVIFLVRYLLILTF